MKYHKFPFKFVFLLLILVFLQTAVLAKDEWLRARSKNFSLIGNAEEKDIRAVALKLEQFREALQRVLGKYNFNSPIPTTVIVFKSAADYKPFKPKKANGETKDIISGTFQSGEDVNYITLSAEGNDSEKIYNIIFHEYTHFLIHNNLGESKIPPWYDEGLAEYFETILIENDLKITLGRKQNDLLALLRQNALIPFETFFNIDNYSLHRQGDDGVGLFYAQAWVLTHYLKQGKNGLRNLQHDKFLELVMAGKNPKTAFAEAFETDYATLENELREYIKQDFFPVSDISLKEKLTFETEITSAPITEAEKEAYLGDLLFHSGRTPEAESYLQNALKLNPDLSMAQTSMALVKLQQEDFEAAQKYLEKAVAADSTNYLAHFNYAYVLSRQGMSEFGFVSEYSARLAEIMRESLRNAIELNPNFAESYDLFAFISIVRNDEIDEAIEYQNAALKIAPGNQWYLIHQAELLMRKEDFAKARNIAAKVLQTAGDKELKVYAQNALRIIISTEAAYDEIRNHKKLPHNYVMDLKLTDEELARLRARQMLESLNEALYKPKENEKRILGVLIQIECRTSEMIYLIKVEDKILKLRSASFESVRLMAYNPVMADGQIGCGEIGKESIAVINYRPAENIKTKTSGELVSIEFVPASFKFLN